MSRDVAIDCPPDEIVQGKTMRAEDAVKALQEAAGMEGKDVDGLFGKKTAEALAEKFGDLTNPDVIAKQSPELQAALKAFDEGVNGSKGYFKKPEECQIIGNDRNTFTPPPQDNDLVSLESIRQKHDMGTFDAPQETISSGPAETGPRARPAELSATAPAEPSQSGLENIRTLGLNSNEPVTGHSVDMAAVTPATGAQESGIQPIQVSTEPALSVVQKDIPGNISHLPEPTAKAELYTSGAVVAAGVNPAQWGGADGANPAFASSTWNLRDMFSQAAEKVADVVENAFSSNTPAPTAAAPQPNTYVLQTGTNGLNM